MSPYEDRVRALKQVEASVARTQKMYAGYFTPKWWQFRRRMKARRRG